VKDEGIRVQAAVVAPLDTGSLINGMFIGDHNDPAQGRSVFQARYAVSWKPRLVPAQSEVIAYARLGETAGFSIELDNYGPDPLTLLGLDLTPTSETAFEVDMPAVPTIRPYGAVTLTGRFHPQTMAFHQANLTVRSDDPSGRHPLILLKGIVYALNAITPMDVTLAAPPSFLKATQFRIDATPNPLVFPDVAAGGQAVATLNVLNPFSTPVLVEISVLQGAPAFYVVAQPVTPVGAQVSQAIQVLFQPGVPGAYAGTLRVAEQAYPLNQRIVAVQGTAH